MDKPYFVVEFAHSLHGQFRRIQISYRALGYAAFAAGFLSLLSLGLFSSYVRMSWRASNYEHLRTDFDRLRVRYLELQRQSSQHKEQMASLESLASEVSAAYGISSSVGSDTVAPLDAYSVRNFRESIQQYTSLQSTELSRDYHRYPYQWQSHNQPSLWPVTGVLLSPFGSRSDPFSGEGAFHTGIDMQAASGTPVHVTGDGVIESAGWSGRYGKIVVVDHGNGIETCYAHLSEFMVIPGEEVRRGEVVALSGGTGRVTGPHLHYEVRLAGTPVNPYRYMAKVQTAQTLKVKHSDLGL